MIQSSINQIIGAAVGSVKDSKPEAVKDTAQTVAQPSQSQVMSKEEIAASDKPATPINSQMNDKAMNSLSEQTKYAQERDKKFQQLLEMVKGAGRHGKGQALYEMKGLASEIEKMEENK